MFVALRTPKRDGHGFLAAARAAGASAALVEVPDSSAGLAQLVVADSLRAFQSVAREHRRSFPGPVVGVTGSAGKTSTKDLLAVLLGGDVLATEGNRNNHLGVPLTLTRLDPAVHSFAVVEAGVGAAGEMAPLASMIEPDVALVTLVAPAHLSGLGGIEGVAREKAALAAAVRLGGIAVFPKSCAAHEAFRSLRVRTLAVGPDSAGARCAVSHRERATEVILGGPAPFSGTFILPRVSDGMARNAALALCVALHLGMDCDLLRRRLALWRPASLRGEVRREDGRLLYLDCYNANPASMADAIEAFARIAPRGEPRLYLIGCMEELGPDSERYHRELGRGLSLRPGDSLVVVGERAGAVREGAVEGGASPDQVAAGVAPEEAAARLAAFRGSVFVKGSRRHELERLLPRAGSSPAGEQAPGPAQKLPC